MAFKLKRNRSIAAGLSRLVNKELGVAHRELAGLEAGEDE
jgi:hypothetical protein